MSAPKNYITALPGYQFTTDQIDEYLPFTGKHVFIRDISKTFTGHGHWKLSVELKIDDKNVILKSSTTNSQLIDEWYIDWREINQETMVRVVAIVLAANENKLEELV